MPNISVDEINFQVTDNADDFVAFCEKNYHKQLGSVSEQLLLKHGRVLVMLAGPSASGKTTTAEILKKNLQAKGRNSLVISLDDFYRDQTESYYFEDGTVDYETVKSIDTDIRHIFTLRY